MSDLFLDSLDEPRLSVFEKLRGFKDLGVLAGGTAIALQIGHRRSFDFDIFIDKPLERPLWRKIRTIFGSNSQKTLDDPDQLNLITPENIAVTFFHDDYPPKFPPLRADIINLMDLKDLASNKARTVGKRGKWRDYVDLFFLLKGKQTTLMEVAEISKGRCGGDFSERLFLQQLSYFEDITDFKIDFLGPIVEPDIIKKFLVEEVNLYSKKILSTS